MHTKQTEEGRESRAAYKVGGEKANKRKEN